MSGGLKHGRWSATEKQYMRDNAGKVPLADMAAHLRKSPEAVATWVRENLAVDVSRGLEAIPLVEVEVRNQLRESSEWEELKLQFVEDELKNFEMKFAKLMGQFRNDVTPSEEMQIIQLIKFSILMDRNMKGRARAMKDVERLSEEIEKLLSKFPPGKPMDEKSRDRHINLENQLLAAREAERSSSGEFIKLSEKHSALMKELKGTRDQRISKWENSKETIIGLLRQLQNEELRKQEGDEIEMMRLALDKEKERLSQSHTYVNDEVDQPLLTPENVG